MNFEMNDEIDFLSKLHIDGIITTNWDDFAEVIFPKFKNMLDNQNSYFLQQQILERFLRYMDVYTNQVQWYSQKKIMKTLLNEMHI